MRFHLLGTVAAAAIALASPTVAQISQPDSPASRGQERPGGLERPGGAERPAAAPAQRAPAGIERPERPSAQGIERAQERQERAQERSLDRDQPRGERSAQPAQQEKQEQRQERRNADTERPNQPRAAEPATPPARNAPATRQTNDDNRREGENPSRNPRAAEPATPAAPAQPQQRNAQPATPTPAQQPAQRDAQPTTPPAAQQQREAQPATPDPKQAPPATAQPATPTPGQTPTASAPTRPEQQRTINETVEREIRQRDVQPTANIGVSVSVGASLPERVRVAPLPREIATVRPEYRDYGLVVTERETIIVDPRTRRVVEVIDRRGGGRGGSAEVVLEQRIERDRVWRNPRVEVREDVILPSDAPLAELPDAYIERSPRYRGYRYVALENEIAIVEPRTRRVVEVIDRNQARRQAQTRGPEPATTASTGGSAAIALSRDDRDEISRTLLRQAGPSSLMSVRDLRGTVLPTAIEIQRLPTAIADRSPELRDMSYVMLGDDVLIVEPESRRIVDVIE